MTHVHLSRQRRAPLLACPAFTLAASLSFVGGAAAADSVASAEVSASTNTESDAPGRSSVPAPAFHSSPRLQRRTDFSSQNMAFELRFGPYAPRIRPVAEDYYGDKTRYQLGFEVDGQLWRAPHVGTLGVGGGWSYTKQSARMPLTNPPEDPEEAAALQAQVAEKSTLNIMPMYVVGVLRVDVLARDFGIPFVGYGKFGLGSALWWENDGSGVSRAYGRKGKDGSWGTQAALGGMFLLDVLEPSAGVELDNSAGINNSYLFLEWSISDLDDDHGNVGTNTWVAGLAVEL
jgi:hypothetical protein